MFAGILLGPSLLGLISPNTLAFLFPPHSLDSLRLLSQLGVITFMFVVGMELDLRLVRRNAHAALLISHASILAPFFLGAALSLLIYRSCAPPHVSFTAFALFMSVAMSITAFPVLARIIEERGLSKSPLGSTALACAAVDDVTAWCLLAVVIAIAKSSGLWGAAVTVLLAAAFIAFMVMVVRRHAERVMSGGVEGEGEGRRRGLVGGVLVVVFASALVTEVIGIHALFGAFLAGVIMPVRGGVREYLTARVEGVTTGMLLPLFFGYTGLRTQVGLLDDWSSWAICGGVMVVAIVGKVGGTMVAARWAGMSWNESGMLGVLMNTRGLIELIVLNIGYELGILTPRVFSMMVIMALVTTCMTGPLLGALGHAGVRSVPETRAGHPLSEPRGADHNRRRSSTHP
jgi:Kef-type K+ transport system membrane component KefB